MQRAILEYRQKLRNIDRVCLVGLSTFSAGREDATHTPGRQNINCIDENKSNKKENAAAGPKKNDGNSSLPPAENKFVSSIASSASFVGGLPGFLLTASDSGKKSMQIIGPRGTSNYWETNRFFFRRENFQVKINEISARDDRQRAGPQEITVTEGRGGEGFKITPIPLILRSPAKSLVLPEDDRALATMGFDENKHTGPTPSSTKKRSRDGANGYKDVNDIATVEILSYLFTTDRIPGKFNPAKAKELGIKPGPIFAKLKAGKSVNLDDGRTIHSREVVAPGHAGAVVGVFFCPSLDVLRQLKSIPALKNLQRPESDCDDRAQQSSVNKNQDERLCVDCMVHITPSELLKSDDYLEWMKLFGPDVKHIVMNDEDCPDESPFRSSTLGTIQRNSICDEIYTIPRSVDTNFLQQDIDSLLDSATKNNSDNNKEEAHEFLDGPPGVEHLYRAKAMLEYTLIPRQKKGMNSSEIRKPLDQSDFLKTQSRLRDSGATDLSASIKKRHFLQKRC